MFTGIVTANGSVQAADIADGVMRLTVGCPAGYTTGLERGASVSVNGVCLTVVAWTEDTMNFDVIDESLQRSNLGEVLAGVGVNLERAARFGDEIGGHPLSGHVHTQATVRSIERTEGNLAMELEVDAEWSRFVISKGYIAINGCSLTIGAVDGGRFWLHLIPETLRITNLSQCTPGDRLNIEIDHQTQVIVETVERYLSDR